MGVNKQEKRMSDAFITPMPAHPFVGKLARVPYREARGCGSVAIPEARGTVDEVRLITTCCGETLIDLLVGGRWYSSSLVKVS